MLEKNYNISDSSVANSYFQLSTKDGTKTVKLKDLLSKPTILVIQPGMSLSNDTLPSNWMSIKGAPGCTGQALGYQKKQFDFELEECNVLFVTSKFSEHQAAVAKEKGLSFGIICDPNLLLKNALNLPTFAVDSYEYYERQTYFLIDGKVNKSFQSNDPKSEAAEVLKYIKNPELTLEEQLALRKNKVGEFTDVFIEDGRVLETLKGNNNEERNISFNLFKSKEAQLKEKLQNHLDQKIEKALTKARPEIQKQFPYTGYRSMWPDINEAENKVKQDIIDKAREKEKYEPIFRVERKYRGI